MNTASLLLLLAPIAMIVGPSFAQGTREPARRPATGTSARPVNEKDALTDKLDAAWRREDWVSIASLLDDAFKIDSTWAAQSSTRIIETSDPFHRPLGVGALVRNASAAELAAAADSLQQTRFPDERRMLVRAIGAHAAKVRANIGPGEKSRKLDDIVSLTLRFLEDRDVNVRTTAIIALADAADAKLVGHFLNQLTDLPSFTQNPPDGDRHFTNKAAHGAALSLSGVRADHARDLKDWWDDTRGVRVASKADDGKYPEGVWNGQRYRVAPMFNIFYRIGGSDEEPGGALSLAELAPKLDRSRQAAERAMAKIVGTTHMPVVRVFLCDPQQFAARAGVQFFQGVTKGNEIILKLEPVQSVPSTMVHEYVHMIHGMYFKDQPRWMSEGLATSLTSSPDEARPVRIPADRNDPLRQMVDRGIFTELVNWNSGGSSDSREGARYALSNIAVDFLRFGGFVEPEVRLFMLMGRLSRKESAMKAFEDVYGAPIRELNGKAAAWAKTE